MTLLQVGLAPPFEFEKYWNKGLCLVREGIFDPDRHLVIEMSFDQAVSFHFLERRGEHRVCDAVDGPSHLAETADTLCIYVAEDQDLPFSAYYPDDLLEPAAFTGNAFAELLADFVRLCFSHSNKILT